MALGSLTMNKASGDDRIPAELFQILKDVAVKCCTQYISKFGKQQLPQDWKRSVFIPIPRKSSAKDCSNYHIIVLISHGNKVMLKILQEKARAPHSSTLAWKIPWMEEPGRLQSMGSLRVRHD